MNDLILIVYAIDLLVALKTLSAFIMMLLTMSGLYVGNKMIHSASNNETFAKAEKLLNKKLDEMLGERCD